VLGYVHSWQLKYHKWLKWHLQSASIRKWRDESNSDNLRSKLPHTDLRRSTILSLSYVYLLRLKQTGWLTDYLSNWATKLFLPSFLPQITKQALADNGFINGTEWESIKADSLCLLFPKCPSVITNVTNCDRNARGIKKTLLYHLSLKHKQSSKKCRSDQIESRRKQN
jgi:hypothetical protein